MLTRHIHGTVGFGFDEWADSEEVLFADSLADELDDDEALVDVELDEDDEDDEP
jgi:hypothetical protein